MWSTEILLNQKSQSNSYKLLLYVAALHQATPLRAPYSGSTTSFNRENYLEIRGKITKIHFSSSLKISTKACGGWKRKSRRAYLIGVCMRKIQIATLLIYTSFPAMSCDQLFETLEKLSKRKKINMTRIIAPL